MIFLGDITSPSQAHSQLLNDIFKRNLSVFGGKSIICNLEGLISDEVTTSQDTPILFSHSSALSVLAMHHTVAVSLANNHVLDSPLNFKRTVELLQESGIAFAGAGSTKEEACEPVRFADSSSEIALFTACWDFLLYHQKNPSEDVHIAEIDEKQLLESVKEHKSHHPDVKVVVFLHWSFDLETLPFPMYRQFARDLVDAGASLVVGTHSHCIQGGESFRDGYIVYGLGNFFLPYNTFAGNRVSFPDFARMQLALEWNPAANTAACHWFEYENEDLNHELKYLGSEPFEQSVTLARYSPFRDLNAHEYLAYFRQHRRKRLLVPIYSDYSRRTTNAVFTWYLKRRARFARSLARRKLWKWAR